MSSPFDKYLFVPFSPRGNDFGGVNCWGLVRLVYRNEFGIELPDWRIACTSAKLINGRAEFERSKWRPLASPSAPCVVAMRNDRHHPTLINHFGVFIGNHRMLHTCRQFKKARRTRIDDVRWAWKIEGFYAPKN